ncbi:MAG: ribonuclease H-like domain-containing protein [Spirochaetaceae bacterium]|nr:ribonuclease H-like domain-containing protein [Spirochaetaceae bacterium]
MFPGAWTSAGYKVLRRSLTLPVSAPLVLPETLSFLIPDIDRLGSEDNGAPFNPEKLLFFDLETTGLSGGAGTVAFLAACGRFIAPRAGEAVSSGTSSGEFTELEITQFLLLDYPGESDFLEGILKTLSSRVLASYNGKTFDSQILKMRCLMNGMTPPLLPQLDLLHPSRCLWKRVLPNCSQALVETMILGLDRSGDLPGSLAPEIWFDFLRADKDRAEPCLQALINICDHNVRDIFGLASLFGAFAAIAAAPLEAPHRFRCDAEQLALNWRRGVRRASKYRSPAPQTVLAGMEGKTAALLLERAAEEYPYSCLRLALDLRASSRHEEARARLLELRDWPQGRKGHCSPRIKALALRALAIDAEKQLRLVSPALAYIEEALALEAFPDTAARENAAPAPPPLSEGLRADLEKRKERLLNKAQ